MKNEPIELIIQLWRDSTYLRFIAIHYEEEYVETCVFTTTYKRREEVVGPEPLIKGQIDIPKAVIEANVRHIINMFLNGIGITKFTNKALFKEFLAKHIHSFFKLKEYILKVKRYDSEMRMIDLKTYLDQFNDKQLNRLKIMVKYEHPEDTKTKEHSDFVFIDSNGDKCYLTLTKQKEIYKIDPYIKANNYVDPRKNFHKSLELNPKYQNGVVLNVDFNIAEDEMEFELLKVYDIMVEENPNKKPTRKELLQMALKKLEEGEKSDKN